MKIGVVIPCYKVKNQISEVLSGMGGEIHHIYVVDDCCPEETGKFVQKNFSNSKITVLFHEKNLGVGGAVMTGYAEALKDNTCDIIIKLDGDGQMDPKLIPIFVKPIIEGRADYTKGNRYFALENLVGMPVVRLIGNAVLSFVNKVSSGYWTIMDPTNGFTAIDRRVLAILPLEKISRRYFFESDMLFRLNCIRAVVKDVPMQSKYGNEKSHLKIYRVIFEFPLKHARNSLKRIFYNYFLRDFSVGSVQLIMGSILFTFGFTFGVTKWLRGIQSHQLTPTGIIFVAALPVLLGVQLLISALNYDIQKEPTDSIHELL